MNNMNYEGIGEIVITMEVRDTVEKGDLVRVVDNQSVGLCKDGEDFCGVAMSARGSCCGVQVKGFANVRYSGDMSAGWNSLVANGENGVRQDAAGAKYLVVNVNPNDNIAVICL